VAIVERPIFEADQGRLSASYSFDDSLTPPLVTTLTATNNSEVGQPINVVVINPANGAIIASRTVNAKTGIRAFDVSNLGGGVRMVDRQDRDGRHYWALPYTIGTQVG
jgi:hypothetical protein